MSRELPQGLVVSCQALKGEPMYGGDSIVKMAYAAVLGGAAGIRANSVRDIKKISRKVDVPIVGLIKSDYPDSPIYITPTLKEIKALIKSPCDIIAMDATARPRPSGETLESLVDYVRAHSDKRIMADIVSLEDAARADALGFDYVSSTLRGYTEESKTAPIPDLDFLAEFVHSLKSARPVAEGGIRDIPTVRRLLGYGFETIIIGGAITRPLEITRHFAQAFTAESAKGSCMKKIQESAHF